MNINIFNILIAGGAIDLLTEWQNLYIKMLIEIVGLGLDDEGLLSKGELLVPIILNRIMCIHILHRWFFGKYDIGCAKRIKKSNGSIS